MEAPATGPLTAETIDLHLQPADQLSLTLKETVREQRALREAAASPAVRRRFDQGRRAETLLDDVMRDIEGEDLLATASSFPGLNMSDAALKLFRPKSRSILLAPKRNKDGVQRYGGELPNGEIVGRDGIDP